VQANSICCSKDLHLLSLETKDKFNCVASLQYGLLWRTIKASKFWPWSVFRGDVEGKLFLDER